MKYKRGFIFICLIICLFSIASVCASDVNEALMASEDQSNDLIELENQDKISTANNAEINAGGIGDNQAILGNSSDTGTFDELHTLIRNTSEGGILELDKDYRYDDVSKEGIEINKAITIDGNGHTLDGNQLSRIFYVSADNVVMKNIIFANGYRDNGGAIYWSGSNGNLSNCSFVNCSSYSAYQSLNRFSDTCGGAIYWSGSNGIVSGCSFVNCHTENGSFSKQFYGAGGAIYWYGERGAVSDCSFVNCSAADGGGAIYWQEVFENECEVLNCSFKNCSAGNGGAIKWTDVEYSIVSNCSFINCLADEISGAIKWGGALNATLSNCNFENCSAENSGAISWDSGKIVVSYCSFVNNTAREGCGGAIWCIIGDELLISNCTFMNNAAADGGALYLEDYNKGMVEDSFFKNNFALNNPNIYNETELTLKNNVFSAPMDYSSDSNATESKVTPQIEVLNNPSEKNSLEVKLPSDATGTVTLTINNTEYSFDIANGVANVIVPNLTDGNYPCTIAYSGDEKYSSVSINESLKINNTSNNPMDNTTGTNTTNTTEGNASDTNTTEPTPEKLSTKLISSNVVTVYNGSKYLVIALKDQNGKAISGVKVTARFSNGKVLTATTDRSGLAKVSTNGLVPVKVYSATITFAGDANYLKSTSKVTVKVIKATPKLTAVAKAYKLRAAKKYYVTLKTNRNVVMKNTLVTVKIGKLTWNARTNAKGVAAFNLAKLNKKANYKATIIYKGNNYYNKVSKTVYIRVV